MQTFSHLADRFTRRVDGDRTVRTGSASAASPVAGQTEPLEERALLTTFTVDTLTDEVVADGRTSLREAILAANTNLPVGDAVAGEAAPVQDRIVIDGSIAGGTILLDATLGRLDVTEAAVITGRSVTLDGTNVTDGVLGVDLADGQQVVIRQLNVINGDSAADGAGVRFTGGGTNAKLGLVQSLIAENVSTGSGGGFAQDGGFAIVSGGNFDSNLAAGGSGSGGGALLTSGTLIVRDTSFTDNEANRAGGGIEVAAGILSVSGSTFTANAAGTGTVANAPAPGNGGGIHTTAASFVVVRDSTFDSNTAANEGGGLWVDAVATTEVRRTDFLNNEARGDRGTGPTGNEGGGGLFNNGGDVTVSDSLFSGNLANGAAGSGGGLLTRDGDVTVFDTRFERNAAARAGGGIEAVGGNVLVTDSTFFANVAGGAVTGPAAPGNGGAVHAAGDGTPVDLVFADVDFLSNRARNEGGGLWTGLDVTTRVTDSLFRGNLSVLGGGFFSQNDTTSTTLTDSVFTANTARRGAGGAVFQQAGRVRVSGGEFTRNAADLRGGAFFNMADGSVMGNVLLVTDASVTGNSAGSTGGGIFTDADATTVTYSATVTGNTPNDFAGPGTVRRIG